jgi:hypothetical protein
MGYSSLQLHDAAVILVGMLSVREIPRAPIHGVISALSCLRQKSEGITKLAGVDSA